MNSMVADLYCAGHGRKIIHMKDKRQVDDSSGFASETEDGDTATRERNWASKWRYLLLDNQIRLIWKRDG